MKRYQRKYTFSLTIEPADGMGLDDVCDIHDVIEEALRDSGIDNAANIKLVLVEAIEGERVSKL